jgi:hypothetical protein
MSKPYWQMYVSRYGCPDDMEVAFELRSYTPKTGLGRWNLFRFDATCDDNEVERSGPFWMNDQTIAQHTQSDGKTTEERRLFEFISENIEEREDDSRMLG